MVSGVGGALIGGGAENPISASFGLFMKATPMVGWVATLAFAYADSQIMASVNKDNPRPDTNELLDVPTGQQGPGSPTIWAIGRRVRTPCHVIFQKSKLREVIPSPKAPTATVERQVFVNALVATNTRFTNRLIQILANGKLLAWNERDLVRVETDGMTLGSSSGTNLVTVSTTSIREVSFAKLFTVGQIVRFQGFVPNGGSAALAQAINDPQGLLIVEVVDDHAGIASPSSMVCRMIRNQGAGPMGLGFTANGGTPSNPAAVIRVESAVDMFTLADITTTGGEPRIRFQGTNFSKIRESFNVGDVVNILGIQPQDLSDRVFKIATIDQFGSTQVLRCDRIAGPVITHAGTWTMGTTNNRCMVRISDTQKVAAGFFPADYDFNAEFSQGSETQSAPQMVVDVKGVGNASAYRGVAHLALRDFNVTQFGNQLPYALETIQEVDPYMTLSSAVREVFLRGDYRVSEFNVDEIEDVPFQGSYFVGRLNPKAALQPIIIAYRLLTQERDSVLHVFTVDACEVIRLAPSDIGWDKYPAPPEGDIKFSQAPTETLPTSIGIKFQDPDLAYSTGYEPYNIRNPSGLGHQKDESANFSTLVLRRRDVRDLGVRIIKLAWINSTTFEVTIPGFYLDLLENDIIIATDSDGNEHTGRIFSRQIVAQFFLVELTCVLEDTDEVPRDTGDSYPAEAPIPVVPNPSILVPLVVDMVAIKDNETFVPGLKLFCSSEIGSGWAGAAVYQSFDNSNWDLIEHFTQRTEIGRTLTSFATASSVAETLGSPTLSTDASTLDVEFTYTGPLGLQSVTEAQAKTGENWFLILRDDGDYEVFAAKTITHLTGNQYRLSGLLRGIRGTFTAAKNPVGAAIGCVVVLLKTYVHIDFAGQVAPSTVYYKFVAAGEGLDDATTITVNPVWRNVLPMPIRDIDLVVGPAPDYDLTVKVNHWSRRVLPLGYVGSYVLDDQPEGYRFRLYNQSNPAIIDFENVVIGSGGAPTLRDRETTFFGTDLIAAGYTPGASITVTLDVQQVNQFGYGPTVKRVYVS